MAELYSDRYDADGQQLKAFSPVGGDDEVVEELDISSLSSAGDQFFVTPLRKGMKLTRISIISSAATEDGDVKVRTLDADGSETLADPDVALAANGTNQADSEMIDYAVPYNVDRADLVYVVGSGAAGTVKVAVTGK